MSHKTSEASLLESWIAGLVLAVGLYVAGRYLWTSFFPIGSALQVMQRLVTAGAIMLGFVLGGYVLSTTVQSVVRKAVEFPSGAVAVVLLLIAWILLNGADYWRVLVVSLVLAIFCAGPLATFLERPRTIPDDQPASADEGERREVAESNTFCVILLVAWWCWYSAMDWWWEGRSPLPYASHQEQTQYLDSSDWKDLRVGVALSGGGYRAALMHAGVLHELRANQVPITHLSTVSGGSIIGAFYALGGDTGQFRDAVGSGRLNVGRFVATLPNAIRLPFPFYVPMLDIQLFPWYSFDRVNVQAGLLNRILLRGSRLRDLRSDPLLQICATDLRTGRAIGISRDSTILLDTPSYGRVTKEGVLAYSRGVPDIYPIDLGAERLATVVAASGAFPGAFNAVRLPRDSKLGDRESELLLSDAGLTDNLGIDLLLERHYARGRWEVDVMIISDGGQAFAENFAARRTSLVDELPRALDVVYKGAGWHNVLGRKLPPIVFVRPSDFKDDKSIEPFWKVFGETPTLASTFKEGQAGTLFELGQKLVQKNWEELREMLDAAKRGKQRPPAP